MSFAISPSTSSSTSPTTATSDTDFICDVAQYEKANIGKLRAKYEDVQSRTYRNWINSVLIQVSVFVTIANQINNCLLYLQSHTSISNIHTDLKSGSILIHLLQALTGEIFCKVNKSNSHLLCIENVSQCLKFIKSKVKEIENNIHKFIFHFL